MTTQSEATTGLHPMAPPGGVMVWLFVFMELLVFGIAFLAFFYMRSQEPTAFASAQKQLNPSYGLINTLILLTSGYLVAIANRAYEERKNTASSTLLLLASGLGVLFLVVKGIEYAQKIALGHTTNTDTFFDFYWLLTAFHAAHVLFGLFLLWFLAFKIKKGSAFDPEGFTLKTGSAFWHMCDIIWVLLFPVLYLL